MEKTITVKAFTGMNEQLKSVFNKRYQVTALLDEGSHGKVLLAKDLERKNTLVALKIFKTKNDEKSRYASCLMMRNEEFILKRLVH